jgi:hypothetical protein
MRADERLHLPGCELWLLLCLGEVGIEFLEQFGLWIAEEVLLLVYQEPAWSADRMTLSPCMSIISIIIMSLQLTRSMLLRLAFHHASRKIDL